MLVILVQFWWKHLLRPRYRFVHTNTLGITRLGCLLFILLFYNKLALVLRLQASVNREVLLGRPFSECVKCIRDASLSEQAARRGVAGVRNRQ